MRGRGCGRVAVGGRGVGGAEKVRGGCGLVGAALVEGLVLGGAVILVVVDGPVNSLAC